MLLLLAEQEVGGQFEDTLALLTDGKLKGWQEYNNVLVSRIATVDISLDESFTYRHLFAIPDICIHMRTFSSVNEHVKGCMELVSRQNPLQKQVELFQVYNHTTSMANPQMSVHCASSSVSQSHMLGFSCLFIAHPCQTA